MGEACCCLCCLSSSLMNRWRRRRARCRYGGRLFFLLALQAIPHASTLSLEWERPAIYLAPIIRVPYALRIVYSFRRHQLVIGWDIPLIMNEKAADALEMFLYIGIRISRNIRINQSSIVLISILPICACVIDRHVVKIWWWMRTVSQQLCRLINPTCWVRDGSANMPVYMILGLLYCRCRCPCQPDRERQSHAAHTVHPEPCLGPE